MNLSKPHSLYFNWIELVENFDTVIWLSYFKMFFKNCKVNKANLFSEIFGNK